MWLAVDLTIAMASNGHRTAHKAHPVQPGASCSTERLGPHAPVPSTCSDSTCGAHTATHQPQPVQRCASIAGRALRDVGMLGSMVSPASVHRDPRAFSAALCGAQFVVRYLLRIFLACVIPSAYQLAVGCFVQQSRFGHKPDLQNKSPKSIA